MRTIDTTRIPSKRVPEPNARSLQLVLDRGDAPGTGDFTLLLSTLFPHSGQTDYHTHPVDEVIYITSGHGFSRSPEGEVPVGAGSTVYARAGEQHQIVNRSSETMRLVCVYIPALPEEAVRRLRQTS